MKIIDFGIFEVTFNINSPNNTIRNNPILIPINTSTGCVGTKVDVATTTSNDSRNTTNIEETNNIGKEVCDNSNNFLLRDEEPFLLSYAK